MTATNHGLFGAVIAITLQKYPAVAIAIAPFSHILLDMIPHFSNPKWDLKGRSFLRFLLFDCTLAVVTTLLVAACAFLAEAPDLMWIYYEYINKPLKTKHKLPRFHHWIQWSATVPGGI